MATIIETIQKRNFLPARPIKEDLPTFNAPLRTSSYTAAAASIATAGVATTTADNLIRLRKRISSFSFSDKIQAPISSTSVASVFARSRSHVPASFSPLLRWWSWGVGWILAARPPIVADLEMNEEEAAVLGTHSKGSLRHVLYRVQSGLRKLVAGSGTQLPVSHKGIGQVWQRGGQEEHEEMDASRFGDDSSTDDSPTAIDYSCCLREDRWMNVI